MWPFSNPNASVVRKHIEQRNRLLSYPDGETYSALNSEISKTDLKIIQCDIEGIVKGIKNKEWTSTEVVWAFVRATQRAQEATNCVTEVNFKNALNRAAELDSAFQKTGELVGPLHGVPFSLKDMFHMAGQKSTVGYTDWVKRPVERNDCALVQVAVHFGAIPLVKTNVPQTMLSFESRNPVFGQTCNPYNKDFISGGSSGGEAALLACDGAAFGFGSDIAGSLRIPTSHCGIHSIKPSDFRGFPMAGNVELTHGFTAVNVVSGPMTRTSKDLELLMKLFYEALYPSIDSVVTAGEAQRRFGSEPLLYSPLRPAWLQPLESVRKRSPLRRRLRIGYYYCDGLIKTSPACVRAIDVAKDALEQINKDDIDAKSPLIEFVPVDSRLLHAYKAGKTFAALASADCYHGLRKPMNRDAMDMSLWLLMLPAISPFFRRLACFIIRYFARDRQMAGIIEGIGAKSAGRYQKTIGDAKDLANDFEAKVWNGLELDAIICPTQALPAVKHYGATELSIIAASTLLYNLVGSAVTCVPVTRVDASRDSSLSTNSGYAKWTGTPGFETCMPLVSQRMYGRPRDGKGGQYDAKSMQGLPIGVQIATRKGEDEMAVGLACLLESQLRKSPKYDFGPGKWTVSRQKTIKA